MNFLDTGTALTNAYEVEKHFIIALVAMYYKLGRYDPSDKFVQTYKNKVLQLYKMTSEEKLDMKHVLYIYKVYAYLHNKKDRTKPINKSKQNKAFH